MDQLQLLTQQKKMGMNWIEREDLVLSFERRKEGGVSHTIGVSAKLYQELGSPKDFVHQSGVYRLCSHSCLKEPLGKPMIASPQVQDGYYFAEPRIFTSSDFKTIHRDQLIERLARSKHVFYTGAGISNGVVPTMAQLEQMLHWQRGNGDDYLLALARQAIDRFDLDIQVMEQFFQAMVFGVPTAAHQALKNMALRQKVSILTENLDLLQHRTGIKPIGPVSPEELIGKTEVNDLESLICLGLSHDDRGFLAWVKKQNPRVTIVSIDLSPPNYLGPEDLWLQADLQQILPELDARASSN